MNVIKRLLALSLALLLSLGLTAPALAAENGGTRRAIVQFEPGADGEQVTQALERLPGVTVLYRYGLLFSGAAVEADASTLEAIGAVEGVAQVSLAADHDRPQAVSEPLLESNSLSLMGAADLPYNGDGVVIAVIDSGLNWFHEAFADYGLSRSPAISREDVTAFMENGGTPGRYISARIPFAYDYCGRDDNVYTTDEHGTHVSALAAGYAETGDGGVKFRGAAPAAQLLSMKVFPDSAGSGANDADILKALEDAYALGADVINLSLGSDNGFTADNALNGLYCQAFQTLREAGVILCCSAGNAASSVSNKPEGATLPTADYTDYGTVCAPATYLGATAVAAVNAQVYESAGYVAAGDQEIAYTDGVSQSGQDLPALASLSGKELEYVVVSGLGTAEDFAGLDVSGRVALVQRGIITFTEKTQNAARAGAVACLVYNNEPGSIQPALEDTAIPCAVISQADGAYLVELAGAEGRGRLAVDPGAFLVEEGEAPAMLSASAWGTTSDLRLVPGLTAPGGNILSASARGKDLYEQLSGTSMAAANASGAFAVLLQALRERGAEDKAQAADLAEALLESAARLVTDENGTPLSPRRQGAGLIDLSAALNSPAVITQPLLELGDSALGRFTFSFRVENLWEETLTFTLDTTVLTDAYDAGGTTAYSLLSPLDITDRVTVSGPKTVTVPAGGQKTVQLTLTVGSGLKKELSAIFPNGFFTEGYVTLTGEDGAGIHASFLGYCGDWGSAPVIEPVDHRDALDAEKLLAETVDEDTGETLREQGYTYEDVLTVNLGANLVYVSENGARSARLLGENPWLAADSGDDRGAISTLDSDALYAGGCLFTVDLYTLRNAPHVVMLISDRRTGRICCVGDSAYLSRAGWDELTGEIKNSARFYWDGTGSDGQPLPNDTRVLVEFYCWLESDEALSAAYGRSACDASRPDSYRWLTSGAYDKYIDWSFPLVIDRTAPTVSAGVGSEPETLTVTVRDNQFLAYASVCDGEGNLLAEGAFADEKAGAAQALAVDLSGYAALPEQLYVTAVDYAANTTGYAIDVSALAGGEAGEPERCAMAVLTDVDREAWYHRAVDYVYAAGLMTGSDPLTFQPGRAATRAQVIEALYQLAGCPQPEPGADGAPVRLPFTDVSFSADYREALLWAYSVGLAKGFNETTFGAYAPVSRQQLAALLYRYAALTEETVPAGDSACLAAFSDGGEVAEWAKEALVWAVERSVLSGDGNGALRPRSYATRAELAQILMNFLED